MGDFIINGKTVASLQIGGKEVIRIADGQTVLWEKTSPQPVSDYLCFTAQQANSTVALTPATGINLTLYKSTDGTNFTSWDGTAVTLVNSGDTLWVYGNNQTLATNTSTYSYFVMNGQIAAAGDVTYLLQNGGLTTLTSNYAFACLFKNCTALTTAPTLPATTLTQGCYYEMFAGCSNLTTAPTLPATTVPQGAYNSMFAGCSSLTAAPALPATTLGDTCYNMMFQYCTNLTTAPQLPATTVPTYGYKDMFNHCTSLTTAPELPATTLNSHCYANMFFGCTSLTTAPDLMAQTIPAYGYHQMFNRCSSLNSVKCMATDISATDCTTSWLYGVAQSGTFTKDSSMTSWTTGTSGIPSGWTVEDYDECTDCSNWQECGYASYEDCMCGQYGEECPPDYCQECIDGCEGDPDCEASCYECGQPCGEPCTVDCNDWENMGYESYEDCDCQINGNCPEEEEPEE